MNKVDASLICIVDSTFARDILKQLKLCEYYMKVF